MNLIKINTHKEFLQNCLTIAEHTSPAGINDALAQAEQALTDGDVCDDQRVNYIRMVQTVKYAKKFYDAQEKMGSNQELMPVTVGGLTQEAGELGLLSAIFAKGSYNVSYPKQARQISYSFDTLDGLLAEEKKAFFDKGKFQSNFRSDPLKLYVLDDVRLAEMGGGIIPIIASGDHWMKLPSVFMDTYSPEYFITKVMMAKEVTKTHEIAFLVRPVGGGNFFFQLTQVLSGLYFYKHYGMDIPLLFLGKPTSFQLKIMEYAGIDTKKILTTDEAFSHRFKKLIAFKDSYYWDDNVVAFYRDVGKSILGASKGNKYPSHIYITRRTAKLRPLKDEKVLEGIALAEGLTPIAFEEYTVEEQLMFAAHATALVGAHGAGMAHMAFAKPGATIIEMFHPNYIIQSFYRRALLCGHQYSAILGQAEGSFTNEREMFWTVEPEKLRAVIKKYC